MKVVITPRGFANYGLDQVERMKSKGLEVHYNATGLSLIHIFACDAVKAGFRTKEIQMPYPASRMMIKSLSDYFSEEDIEKIRYIQSQGIRMFFQTAPFDNKDYSIFKK